MLEFYPAIKLLHITTVLVSGSIFTLRGVLMLLRSERSNHPVLKWSSYVNDSVLLTAGLLLMQITQQYPVSQHWLSVKLSLLVAYIVLGVFALRAGKSQGSRAVFFFAALTTYLFMISIARSHNPLGFFVSHSVFWPT